MSTDPHDLVALTPGHFLIGEPLLAIPEPPTPEKIPIGKRYLQVTQMRDNFWSRFRKEYLHQLQVLTKWNTLKDSVKVGCLVLIKDETLPATKWALARVTKVFPDSAGVVRSVELFTATGSTTRPIHKLVLLPVIDTSS